MNSATELAKGGSPILRCVVKLKRDTCVDLRDFFTLPDELECSHNVPPAWAHLLLRSFSTMRATLWLLLFLFVGRLPAEDGHADESQRHVQV